MPLSRSDKIIDTIEEFTRCLHKLDPEHPGFVCHCDDLLESLSPDVAENAYIPIFDYFKLHPESDVGAPGALIHHVERYGTNYIPALLHDAKTFPSYNSILMVNRILNSELTDADRFQMMEILRQTADAKHVSEIINELASELLEYQTEKQQNA